MPGGATVVYVNQLDGLRRYLDAATTLTQITRGRAEELVRDLVASGELERARAQEWIEDLLNRSREASEVLVSSISAEVDRQLADLGLKNLDLDDLAQKVAGLLEHAGTVGRNVSVPKVWSRGADSSPTTAGSRHQAPTNGAGRDKDRPEEKGKPEESKSVSGKKKNGSGKSGSKQGKKGPESKKPESKKSAPDKTGAKKSRPDTALPDTAETEKASAPTQSVDRGVAT
jgi:polyhydroxyalkanoate synthesis regulator phasin